MKCHEIRKCHVTNMQFSFLGMKKNVFKPQRLNVFAIRVLIVYLMFNLPQSLFKDGHALSLYTDISRA